MTNKYHEIFFRNIFKLLTALVIVLTFLYILSPFLIPFLFGGMLAMALSPFLKIFMEKKGWTRNKSLMILSAVFFVVGAVPFSVFFIRGARIISHFFSQQSFSVLTQSAQVKIYTFLDHFAELNGLDSLMVREKFNEFINQAASFIFKNFSNLISQIPDLMLVGFVTIISFYFFLLKEDQIRVFFDRYFYFSKSNSDKFISVMKSCCGEVFFSNVLAGILQSSIVSFGALACGIGDFYITFIVTFILSFIPVIGASPMAFAFALYAFFEDRNGAAITMTVIGTISGLADNLIRPYLVSLGKVEVPALIGFLSVLGGVIALGLPGLFVGPLLAALMHGVIPIIIDEYFPVEEEAMNNNNNENSSEV